MANTELHSSPSDWQGALLEAIQQRDASRAVLLAQRCVHRYGMPALEALLERANEVWAENGAARDWLLPLLTQPSSPPEPIHPAPAQLETISPPLPAATRLDEAFAPLEIAFPPLLMGGAAVVQQLVPQEPERADVAPDVLEGVEEKGAGEAADNANAGEPPAQAEPLSPRIQVWGEQVPPSQAALPSTADTPDLANEEPRLEPFEAIAARPLPPFAPDIPLEAQPSEKRVRYPGRRATNRPAPISPELERWLVWLPCAGRPAARR